MKQKIALLLVAVLILSLCACTAKKTEESPSPSIESPVVSELSEKTYRLNNYPLAFTRSDGVQETVYLTSITLRAECTVCTFLRALDAPANPEFPELEADTRDGGKYVLSPCFIGNSTVCFDEMKTIPVKEISSIVSSEGANIDLANIQNNFDALSELYTQKLNTVMDMSYNELFAFCLGSDGAYAEGAYGELGKRMVADPEEFALHLLAPAYPFSESAKSFIQTADVTKAFYTSFGFDDDTDESICLGICAACLAPNVQSVINTLTELGYTDVSQKLSKALSEVR